MDGTRAGTQRRLVRACEPHRLQEELWVAAYEEICPLLRRVVKQRQPAEQGERAERLAVADGLARRA